MILMIFGALLGGRFGSFLQQFRSFFLSVILGANLELPWYSRGGPAAARLG
jgi:hypothetical protein